MDQLVYKQRDAKNCQQLEGRHRMDSPSETSEGTNPADTLILDFWSSELRENIFPLV